MLRLKKRNFQRAAMGLQTAGSLRSYLSKDSLYSPAWPNSNAPDHSGKPRSGVHILNAASASMMSRSEGLFQVPIPTWVSLPKYYWVRLAAQAKWADSVRYI